MADREKVIRGLECCLDVNGSKFAHCLTCDYRRDVDHCQWTCQTDEILEDALALLKAQEPNPMPGAGLTDAELMEKIRKAPITQKPPVFGVRVMRGRWIEHEDCNGDSYYTCSACGCDWTMIEGTPEWNGMRYCPSCGARMSGETEE